MLSPDQARIAAGLPTPDAWPGLSADEREYRAQVIAEVENGNVEEALDAADAQAEEASLRYQHDEAFESIREGLRHEQNV